MMSSFCHFFGSDNYTGLRISSSGGCCPSPKRGKLLEVLEYLVDTTDEVLNICVVGFIQPPSELSLLVLKRFWRKEVVDEILHH